MLNVFCTWTTVIPKEVNKLQYAKQYLKKWTWLSIVTTWKTKRKAFSISCYCKKDSLSLYYVQVVEKTNQAEKDEAFWNTEDISKSCRCSSTQNQTKQPDGHQLENKDK